MNKNVVIGILLVVVAVGAYYMFSDKELPAVAVDTSAPDNQAMESTQGAADMGKHSVAWSFTPAGEDAVTGAEKTKVTVTWDGTSHDAGTYLGSCAEIDGTNGSLDENQVSGALCWFAGAGDEIGVFNEGGTYVLKHGEQQEPSAESQGFRGNFKTLITL